MTDKTETTLSKGQKAAADVTALLRARNPLLWIITREETRVENLIAKAAVNAGYDPLYWDCAQGVTDIKTDEVRLGGTDLNDTLQAIKTRAKDKTSPSGFRNAWILRDAANPWLVDPNLGATPRRTLRNLVKFLPGVPRKNAQAVIVLTTETNVPVDLANHATVIEWPLPDRSEIEIVLNAAIRGVPEYEKKEDADGNQTEEDDLDKPLRARACVPEVREACLDAAIGLSAEEAAACYAKSIISTKKIDPQLVAQEKKRVITANSALEWVEPVKGGLSAIGGLDEFKGWLGKRKNAYSPEARDYGLKAPKGVVLVGISGCGKSLSAKCVPAAWDGMPLLRLDLGALKDKYVGGSEGNIRKALKIVAAIGRCVLWIDEIEKSIQSGNSAASDGGVSSDQLGVILSWMQERTCEAFVIATANDTRGLPPELTRKGRFDDIFYIDLPVVHEREDILKAALRANGIPDVKVNFDQVANATAGFTGAEIAELVPTAMFDAFDDGKRPIKTADLLKAAKEVYPLSKSAGEKIEDLRKWAEQNARPASAKKKEEVVPVVVELDL